MINTQQKVIEADKFYQRKYIEVQINNQMEEKALIDSGAEVCCVAGEVVRNLKVPVSGKLWVTGLDQNAKEVDVVCLQLKPILSNREVKKYCTSGTGMVCGNPRIE